jgi:serine-type D-Ala-D-Ala carboxypeptidase/endopeptidase (penicillin-binding protein 4)
VTNPSNAAAAALADALRRRGVTVGGFSIVRDSAEAVRLREGTSVIGAFESPPMERIVAAILRPSQNWIAEQVAKTLGAQYAGDGSWRGGNRIQRDYLVNAVGLDSLAVNLRDASGMSAQNLLTPTATIAILAHARTQPWAAAFRDGLPQPGMTGSTLSSRLAGLEGRVFAKTGTISNVNSLSGYFVATDGREYLFSILSNGSGLPSAPVRAAIDDVVRAMARHLDR